MILMHKDIPVADVTVANGSIIAVKSIFNIDHYPVGAMTQHPQMAGKFLDNWAKMRCIPKDRQNAKQIIQNIKCSLNEAIYKEHGVSITDCYWFKEANEDISWGEINYFNGNFSDNYSRKLLWNINNELDFKTPDFRTDGVLEKYWLFIEEEPVLCKFGNLEEMIKEKNLLSANEIIATKIAELMNITHVEYFPLEIREGEMICGCKSFIEDDNAEFVNALQLYKANLKNHNDTCMLFCNLGLGKFISEMIVFDFFIGNTDRHRKNFGIIRNPDTLEIISAAPLFDSGTSLGWNGEYDITRLSMKPFDDNSLEQLKIANTKLVNIPDEQKVCEIIKEVYELFSISDEHSEAVQNMVKNNINIVKNLSTVK